MDVLTPAYPSLKAMLVVGVFAVAYIGYMIRKTARQELDFYDLLMLSMVAVIPVAFTFFPRFAFWVSSVAGVSFPFIVMFGLLLAVLFIFVNRLTAQMHRVRDENRNLIQEMSLLRLEMKRRPSEEP